MYSPSKAETQPVGRVRFDFGFRILEFWILDFRHLDFGFESAFRIPKSAIRAPSLPLRFLPGGPRCVEVNDVRRILVRQRRVRHAELGGQFHPRQMARQPQSDAGYFGGVFLTLDTVRLLSALKFSSFDYILSK